MVTTMDKAGRLVIPSDIRREASITPGTPLDVRVRDGVIEIEPQALAVEFVKRGRFLVARPKQEVPALTAGAVERVRQQLRRRRGR